MKSKFLMGTALALGLVSTGASAATNLVQNGSFEANVLAAGTWSVFGNFANAPGGVTDWNSFLYQELRNNVAGTAKEGVNYAELDVYSNTQIFQFVTTTVGQTYTLEFWQSARAGTAAATNGMYYAVGNINDSANYVSINGVTNATADNVWQKVSVNFVASSTTTGLTFGGLGTADGYGQSLDNISITAAVPEPGEWAMMAAGLSLVGVMVRRRRNVR